MTNDIKTRLDLLNTKMAIVKQTIVDHHSGEIYISWKDDKMLVKFTTSIDVEVHSTDHLTNRPERS